MKKCQYFLVAALFTALITGCEKTDDAESDFFYTTRFGDKVISASDEYAHSDDWVTDSIDIDRNGIYDVEIISSAAYTRDWGSTYSLEIKPKKGFEIAFTECYYSRSYRDSETQEYYSEHYTAYVPEVFNSGDTISVNGTYTSKALVLIYKRSPAGMTFYSEGEYQYGIKDKGDYFYIALRKTTRDKNLLAWIKVKLTGTVGLLLNSCGYTPDKEYLVLK